MDERINQILTTVEEKGNQQQVQIIYLPELQPFLATKAERDNAQMQINSILKTINSIPCIKNFADFEHLAKSYIPRNDKLLQQVLSDTLSDWNTSNFLKGGKPNGNKPTPSKNVEDVQTGQSSNQIQKLNSKFANVNCCDSYSKPDSKNFSNNSKHYCNECKVKIYDDCRELIAKFKEQSINASYKAEKQHEFSYVTHKYFGTLSSKDLGAVTQFSKFRNQTGKNMCLNEVIQDTTCVKEPTSPDMNDLSVKSGTSCRKFFNKNSSSKSNSANISLNTSKQVLHSSLNTSKQVLYSKSEIKNSDHVISNRESGTGRQNGAKCGQMFYPLTHQSKPAPVASPSTSPQTPSAEATQHMRTRAEPAEPADVTQHMRARAAVRAGKLDDVTILPIHEINFETFII